MLLYELIRPGAYVQDAIHLVSLVGLLFWPPIKVRFSILPPKARFTVWIAGAGKDFIGFPRLAGALPVEQRLTAIGAGKLRHHSRRLFFGLAGGAVVIGQKDIVTVRMPLFVVASPICPPIVFP